MYSEFCTSCRQLNLQLAPFEAGLTLVRLTCGSHNLRMLRPCSSDWSRKGFGAPCPWKHPWSERSTSEDPMATKVMTVGRNRNSHLGHIWVPKKGNLKCEKSHWYSLLVQIHTILIAMVKKMHTHTTGIYRYGHWLQQQLGFLLISRMLGVMTGCWDSHRHVRLIVLGVEFFHAGIGDLFSAMLQSTSTTVIDLG